MARAATPTNGWTVAGFLALAAATNYADRAAFSSVIPPLRAQLGLSDAGIGLVSSIFLWTYAGASPLAGLLADRWPRAKLVGLSLCGWSVITALTGWANGLVTLCLCRAGLGLLESFFHPAAFALIAAYHPAQTRARAMSLLSVGFQCGVVAGGTIAGTLADRFGWRVGFWVLGGFGLLLTGLTPNYLPFNARGRSGVKRAHSQAGIFHYLARTPSFQVLLVKSMLTGITTWIFFAWLPLYFQEQFSLSLGAAGFLGTVMLQASKVVGIGLGGWASDRLSARGKERRFLVLAGCYLLASPVLLLFLTHPSLVATAAVVSCFSLLGGMGLANEQPALCEVIPARLRSTAIGFSNTCATAAGGLGVLVAGILKGRVGLSTVFAGSAAIYLVSAACLLLAFRCWVQRDIALAENQNRADEVASELPIDAA